MVPWKVSHEGRKLKPAPKYAETDSYGISYYITIMNHSDWSFLMLVISHGLNSQCVCYHHLGVYHLIRNMIGCIWFIPWSKSKYQPSLSLDFVGSIATVSHVCWDNKPISLRGVINDWLQLLGLSLNQYWQLNSCSYSHVSPFNQWIVHTSDSTIQWLFTISSR